MLAGFLLLSPIFILPTIGNITALKFYQFGVIDSSNSFLQLQFYQFGAVVLFLVSMFCKKKREFNDKWLSLFMLGCLVSVFLHPITIKVFANIFLGFLLYKVVYEYADNIKVILFPILIVSILNFIFSVMQSLGFYYIYHAPAGQSASIYGLMASPTHLGIYQALAIPVSFIYSPYLIVIPVVSLFLAHSHTAFLGVWVAVIYLARKKIIYLGSLWSMFIMSMTALIVVLNYHKIMGELSARIWIWEETIKHLTFFGSGKFSFTSPMGTFDNPYNIYLEVLYKMGIFSIPLFIWIYRTIKGYVDFKNKDVFIKILFTSCLMLLAMGLRSSFMDFPRLAGTTIVLFALLNTKPKGGFYADGIFEICGRASQR